MKQKVLLSLLAAAAFFGLLIYLTLPQRKNRVEVCMTFMGRTDCRRASGETRQQAIQTAVQNACAHISSGMTDSIECERTRPDRITDLQ